MQEPHGLRQCFRAETGRADARIETTFQAEVNRIRARMQGRLELRQTTGRGQDLRLQPCFRHNQSWS